MARFLSFDEQPIAAASIAQVHHGLLKDNQEVAVKVALFDRNMTLFSFTCEVFSSFCFSLYSIGVGPSDHKIEKVDILIASRIVS